MKPTAAEIAAATYRAPLMSERAIGAIHYRIIALCFAAWIFDFYDLILYSFMLLPIARDLHLSQTESSLTLGLALAMTAVGGVIFGFVGDRFGRKPTIIVCVLIYGVGTTLCAASLQFSRFRFDANRSGYRNIRFQKTIRSAQDPLGRAGSSSPRAGRNAGVFFALSIFNRFYPMEESEKYRWSCVRVLCKLIPSS